jgi:hypothetical protein
MVAITIITCIDTNLNKTVNSDAAANAKQTNVDILYAHLYPISIHILYHKACATENQHPKQKRTAANRILFCGWRYASGQCLLEGCPETLE